MNNKPLIVHSDRKIYLIEKLDSDYAVEDQLNAFATLVHTPNNVHTYYLDKYSLWSAVILEYKEEEIIDFLENNSKNILPSTIVEYVTQTINEFWEADIFVERDVFSLKGNSNAIDKILNIKAIKSKVIEQKMDNVIFEKKNLYEVREELLKNNVYLRENSKSLTSCDLKLNQDVMLYRYQKEAVGSFVNLRKNNISGRGVIIMPPGSGKTLVALKIIELFKINTLILVKGKEQYNAWIEEIEHKTNFHEKDIAFNDLASSKVISICTYAHASRKLKDDSFNTEWGLIIYDNANCLPAGSYSKTAYITSKYKLAMDSIIWRSDKKENLIFKAIGPKIFNLTLRKLEYENYQIKVKCYEVKIPFKPWDVKEEKNGNHTYSKNLNKVEAYKRIYELHKNEQKILVSHFIKVAKKFSETLTIPHCHGESKYDFRENLVNSFNNKEIDSIILTDIFENQLLGDIDLLVSLSYNGKSEREEFKRIGKLKGCNKNINKIGYYYALVSQDTIEEEIYITRRNDMLKHGYNFRIITLDELRGELNEV